MLRLIDIHKTYTIGPTAVHVLRGITLTVEKGELFSIMGPSGCGKSTLMNVMGLLDKPNSGDYFIDEAQINYDNDRALSSFRNRRIGFAFQAYNLLPRLTALENVGLPLVYRGLGEREIRERSLAYLEKVEMADRAHHKPSELSGGQQQRVAIARALVGNPSLILADEPTGALDSQVGRDILNLFQKLNAEEGITFVIITHDIQIARQCQRMVRMSDGVLVE